MQECIGFLKLVRLRLKSVVAFGAGKTGLVLYRVFFFMSMKAFTSSVIISFFLPLPGFRSHETVCHSQYFFTVLRDTPSIFATLR